MTTPPTGLPTVIVPVHGRADDVQRCLRSVVRHAGTTPELHLLVIDDASPGPEVGRVLDGVAGSPGRVVLEVRRNDENLGFAATVNRGIEQVAGDVVLLNSDTVVTAGWLERLVDAARPPDVATVTPLTDDGSICSLPADIVAAWSFDADDQVDELAAVVRQSSLALRPEVIAGVGFCLYVTRRAIDRVGLLDGDHFGRGYGEEVDFCLRATDLGFRHLVEDSTFVHHAGGASFGDSSAAAKARGSVLLHERHPDFKARNTAERRADPLRTVAAAVRLHLAPRDPARPHVLHVLHEPSRYGGTESFVASLVDALAPGLDASMLTPTSEGALLTTHWLQPDGDVARHELLLGAGRVDADAIEDESSAEVMRTVLELFGFTAVHVHNLIGHTLAPLAALADFPGPVVCSVHDYFLACPHHWLLYRNEVSCGIPEDLTVCAACLPETRGLPVDHLVAFRAAVRRHLEVIDHWVFPSASAADQLSGLYPIDPARLHVVPHGTLSTPDPSLRLVDEQHVMEAPLRVAFVGRGWAKKGLGVVNRVAEDLGGSGIEIHHFGEPKEPASERVWPHGAYDSTRLPEILRTAGIHVVWLPGPYAETFGLVMSEALGAGLPVLGPPDGAIGERIRDLGVGWVVDPADTDALGELLRDLAGARLELLRATRAAAAAPLAPIGATTSTYAELYGS